MNLIKNTCVFFLPALSRHAPTSPQPQGTLKKKAIGEQTPTAGNAQLAIVSLNFQDQRLAPNTQHICS